MYVTILVQIARVVPPARHTPSAVTGGHAVMPSLSATAGHAVESVPLPVLHISAPTGFYESYRISWFGVWKVTVSTRCAQMNADCIAGDQSMMGLSSTMAAAKYLRYKVPCHMQHFEKVSMQCVIGSVRYTPGSSI